MPSNFPQLCKKDIGGTKILMLVYFFMLVMSWQVSFLVDNIRRENQLRLKLGGNEIKARLLHTLGILTFVSCIFDWQKSNPK